MANKEDQPLSNILDAKDQVDFTQGEFEGDGQSIQPQWDESIDYPDLEEIELPRGEDFYDTDSGNVPAPAITGNQSLFNDFHLYRYKGDKDDSYPVLEEQQTDSKFRDLYTKTKLTDLITNPKGHRIYKATDFLYLKDIGTPINRMITLRRFPFPVLDDITTSNKDVTADHDIGRLVTFMSDEANRLSDIMNFSYRLKWRELTAATERAQMEGDQNGVNGFMGDIMKFIDPKFGSEKMMGDNRLNYDPTFDNNRTHGPVDVIANTHIRDIGFEFDFEMQIQFRYKLESINGINGKTAFIDLLSNILAVTYNNGKFWGGARYWTGPRPTKYLKDLQFLSATSFDDFLNKGFLQMKSVLGKFTGPDAGKNAVQLLKTIAFNALNLGFGHLLDKIGRPSIPMITSLLSNAPIGNWHLTIGNPLNPIATIGNLIIMNSNITLGDTLGYDDFPEDIVLEVTLKPAMAKDRAGVESMFNMGKGRTYWKPSELALRNRANGGKSSGRGGRSSVSYNENITKGLAYNELISRPIDFIFTGKYDAQSARDALKDSIYDFRQISPSEQAEKKNHMKSSTKNNPK